MPLWFSADDMKVALNFVEAIVYKTNITNRYNNSGTYLQLRTVDDKLHLRQKAENVDLIFNESMNDLTT